MRRFRSGFHDHNAAKLPAHREDWGIVLKRERIAAKQREEAMGVERVEDIKTAEQLKRAEDEARKKLQCQWTHVDEHTSKRYMCANLRFVHPTRFVTDRYGVRVPEEFAVCAWHMAYCCGDHGVRVRQVAIPNDQALCTSCYVRATGADLKRRGRSVETGSRRRRGDGDRLRRRYRGAGRGRDVDVP